MAYEVDKNDKSLVDITNNKNEALTENEKIYDDMISSSQGYYDSLIENSKNWAEEQKNLQNEQTDFAIQKINQQKEQAEKDYIKEQSGAYVDWQKEKDSYGAGAEQRAAAGLAGAGYSESAQVSLYNTYQNRAATAREAYGRAVLNYDNAIQEAKLQNNSILAEIAFDSLQKQLELSLQGFQYKNQLIIDKSNKKLEIEGMYHSQYMQMYNQLLQEQQFKFNQDQAAKDEAYRQAQLALEREKFNYQKEQDAASQVKVTKSGSGSSGGSSSSGRNTTNAKIVEKYGKKENSGFTGTTYNEAVEYMTKHGVDNSYASNIMTAAEFVVAKHSGRGMANTYDSYADYLKYEVNNAING